MALNHEKTKKDLQRITKTKPFINKYNLEGINFPSEESDWKKIEKNNVTTALNVYWKNISCLSFKTYLKSLKKVILSMIADGKKWHYIALKKLSALLRGITSKYHGDFYCLNCLHSFATEKKT